MGLDRAGAKEDFIREGKEWQCAGFARFSEQRYFHNALRPLCSLLSIRETMTTEGTEEHRGNS